MRPILRRRFWIYLVLLSCLTAGSLPGQDWDNWDAGGEEEEFLEDRGAADGVGDALSGFGHWFYEEFILSIYKLGKGSWDRAIPKPQRADVDGEGDYPYRRPDIDRLHPRELGDPELPFLRVEGAHMYENRDLFAVDGRIEVGVGMLGGQYRATRFISRDPHDIYEIHQWHALLRLTFAEYLGLDLGVGMMTLAGEDRDRSGSVSAALLYHPWDWLGFEFRTAFASINENRIEDYDLSLLLSWRTVSLRFGGRRINGEDGKLEGPYAGLSIQF